MGTLQVQWLLHIQFLDYSNLINFKIFTWVGEVFFFLFLFFKLVKGKSYMGRSFPLLIQKEKVDKFTNEKEVGSQ
jgi:hypothetical protein